ncbi:MAG: DUF1538 domain-containing protein, partial [Candidatus Margulisbacteria bacterium]|nr:DUF1538 domain-containing protein [Candidatus Margulisiibacteriota bacterium]
MLNQSEILPKNRSWQISWRQASTLVASYASAKIGAQLKAVAFVVIYLFLAQTFILRVPVEHSLLVALGVGATVLGLAFFLEGLFLGVMPLGEQCGLRLPQKVGVWGVAVFAIVIGVTATIAEPAIGFLKIQGRAVEAWNAPLLYLLLNRGANWLVLAIAAGVGLAVLLGMFRFIYGWAFKPAVYLSMPLLLLLGFFLEQNPILRPVANLAWDTGGVTTGPVTVPLIIALGIGVSKIASAKKTGSSGLGVVTLASALPILTVFILAVCLLGKVPNVSSAPAFFSASPEVRAKAEYVAGGRNALLDLAGAAARKGAISQMELKANFPDAALPAALPAANQTGDLSQMLTALKSSLLTVLPLALVLIAAIWFIVRERIREADITALGIVFTILG